MSELRVFLNPGIPFLAAVNPPRLSSKAEIVNVESDDAGVRFELRMAFYAESEDE